MATERFSINSAMVNKFKSELLFVTKSKFSEDWTSVLHSHPFTEIFYITNGKGYFINRQGNRAVSANDMFIINAEVEHSEVSSHEDPLEYISIGINNLSFSSLTGEKTTYDFFHFNDGKKNFLDFFKIMLDEVREQQTDYALMCQNYTEVIITEIIRKHKLKVQFDSSQHLSKEVAMAKQHINQNFREVITLDQLAELTHLNKFYFSHIFKKEMSRAPIDYLNHRRIEESKFLLRSTDYSISQIAHIVGFSSQSYFSGVFKKYEKQTPTNFRDQLNTDNE